MRCDSYNRVMFMALFPILFLQGNIPNPLGEGKRMESWFEKELPETVKANLGRRYKKMSREMTSPT